MTSFQKIRGFFAGLFLILLSVVIMIIDTRYGFLLVCAVICFTLFFVGIRSLIFYFTMARHMVGGRRQLYIGVIMFDLGMFTMTMDDIPIFYIILYLIGIHMFSGVVELLSSLEAKKLETPVWRSRMLSAIGNIAIALGCLYFGFFRKSVDTVVTLYACGLFYNGVLRISNSFRKTENVYIQ